LRAAPKTADLQEVQELLLCPGQRMLSQLLQERGRLGERTTARQDVGHVGHVGHGGDVAEGGQVGTIDSRGGGKEGSQASDLVELRMLEKYRVKAVRDFVE